MAVPNTDPNAVPPVEQPAAQPAPVVAQAPAAAPAAELPQDVRAQTREQFEKLLENNRKLFEANEQLRRDMSARAAANQTFAPIQNAPVPQPINTNEFVEIDPTTGDKFINDQKLKAKMEELNQRASRAEAAVNSYIKTSEDREIEKQNRETFQAYPELNPADKEKFDPAFHKQVRGIIFDSMYNPAEYGGRPLTFKESADLVSIQFTGKKTPAKPEAPAGPTAADQKVDAAAGVTSAPQNAPQPTHDEDLVELRRATRYGSDEALARRLLNTEHIVSK